MEKESKIYLTGTRGLVGSSLERVLRREGYGNIVSRPREELDLRDQRLVDEFFKQERPDYVFMTAAKVGGIMANMKQGAEFIYDNMQMQSNVIHSSWKHGVKKLLFLGSSCIYPKDCMQPIREEYFLTGPFEPTNKPYAVAKSAGIEMCRAYNQQYGTDFISVIPTNLFGPGDNFDPVNSHLLAALIRKFHEAKVRKDREVTLWGSGTPRRELLYVDECSEACLFLMNNYDSGEIVNIGTGVDLSIHEIAQQVSKVVGFEGELKLDLTKPDGMMRKLLDVTKINSLGWRANVNFPLEIEKTYDWFKQNIV